MKHTHISNRNALGMVSEMLQNQYRSDLKENLSKQIRIVRHYLAMVCHEGLENLNSWDCGRQDAYIDRVEAMFSRLEILMGAYQLSKGRSTKFAHAVIRAIGEDQIEIVVQP